MTQECFVFQPCFCFEDVQMPVYINKMYNVGQKYSLFLDPSREWPCRPLGQGCLL